MDPSNAPRLPPLTGVKRTASTAWGSATTDLLTGVATPVSASSAATVLNDFSSSPLAASMSMRAHHRGLSMDESAQFAAAAESGARAQREVDSARGTGVFETYELGIAIVRSSKLYANQRRSNRQLPGGSDSTTAACYMLGGTPDSTLSPLVARVSPCDPREERCKAVERVLKDKTRGAICSLNGDNPREARADNLAAVRICEVIADILVAYAAKRLLSNLQELYRNNNAKDNTIQQLRAQLDNAKRSRTDNGPCWCGRSGNSSPPQNGQKVAAAAAAAAAVAAAPPATGTGTDSIFGANPLALLPSRTLAPPPTMSNPLGVALARSSALPVGSSPLGVAAAAGVADTYAGALDAVAAANQWPHAERK